MSENHPTRIPPPSIQILESPEAQSPRTSSPSPRSTPSPRRGGRSTRHPTYRGVRARSGKWVSEIREPRKTTRIWLGTYPTPEMAAAAYDVAALALKGPDTALNFPESRLSYRIPASNSAGDIRTAAAQAAEARQPRQAGEEEKQQARAAGEAAAGDTSTSGAQEPMQSEQFVDEDELLNMPSLLIDMAEGMMVSPPRMNPDDDSDDPPGDSGGNSLWTYP